MEGKDTVVVMTIKQAQDINNVFANQKSEIHKLNQDLLDMRSVADSLATDLIRTKVILNKTQQNLIVAELKTQRMLNRQAQLFFGFWVTFVTYLELTK